MITGDWLIETTVTSLVLRMNLIPEHAHQPAGAEAIDAQIVSRHWDEDGPVFGTFTYKTVSGAAGGSLTFMCSADPDYWPRIAEDALGSWATEWRPTQHNIIQRRWQDDQQRFRWQSLAPASFLATQHLARLEGAMGQLPHGNTDSRALVHTTMSRLRSMITQANREWGRLTAGI